MSIEFLRSKLAAGNGLTHEELANLVAELSGEIKINGIDEDAAKNVVDEIRQMDQHTRVIRELRIEKHGKIQSDFGSIVAHVGRDVVGVFATADGKQDQDGATSIVIDKRLGVQLLFWLPQSYFEKGAARLPLAMYKGGLQVPQPDGRVNTFAWDKVLPKLTALLGV